MAAPAPQVEQMAEIVGGGSRGGNFGMASAPVAPPRRAGGRTFALRDSTWWEARAVRLESQLRVVSVKPYSAAWFALADAVPELKTIFAVGERVRVAGRAVAIEVSPRGVETLDAAAVKRVIQDWGA
jgi:hypothetical protein